jgi:hypothetical protein
MVLEVELCKSLGKFASFRFAFLQAELPVAYPVLARHSKFEKKKN